MQYVKALKRRGDLENETLFKGLTDGAKGKINLQVQYSADNNVNTVLPVTDQLLKIRVGISRNKKGVHVIRDGPFVGGFERLPPSDAYNAQRGGGKDDGKKRGYYYHTRK